MTGQRRFLCCLAATLGLAALSVRLADEPVRIVPDPPAPAPAPVAAPVPAIVLPTRPRPPPTFTGKPWLPVTDIERLRIDPWGLALRLGEEARRLRIAKRPLPPPFPSEGRSAAFDAIVHENPMILSVGNAPAEEFTDPETGLPVRFLGSVVTDEDLAFASDFNAEICRGMLDGRIRLDLRGLERMASASGAERLRRFRKRGHRYFERESRLAASLLARPADGSLAAAGRRWILDLGAGHGLRCGTVFAVWRDRGGGPPEIAATVRVTAVSFWRSEAVLRGLIWHPPAPGMRVSSPFFRPGRPTSVWVDSSAPCVNERLAGMGVLLREELDASVDLAVIAAGDAKTRALARGQGVPVVEAAWIRALLLFW